MVKVKRPPPFEGWWGLKPIKRVADRLISDGKYKRPCWEWLCFCSNTFEAELANVRSGNTKSCGCSAINQGKARVKTPPTTIWGCEPLYQVLDYISPKGKHYARWCWRCFCGVVFEANLASLRDGNTRSCGCKTPVSTKKTVPIGHQLGGTRLVVAEAPSQKRSNGRSSLACWLVECQRCGDRAVLTGSNIRRQNNACRCSSKSSPSEEEVFSVVQAHFLDARPGVRGLLSTKRFELDVWVPSLRAGIEYDGWQHRFNQERDSKKNAECAQAGISLYRIHWRAYSRNPYTELWKLLCWLRAREVEMKERAA